MNNTKNLERATAVSVDALLSQKNLEKMLSDISENDAEILISRLLKKFSLGKAALASLFENANENQITKIDTTTKIVAEEKTDVVEKVIASEKVVVTEKTVTDEKLNKQEKVIHEEKTQSEFAKRKAAKNSQRIDDKKLYEWLNDFWISEKSRYVQERRAHDMPCTERHCYEMRGIINRYWLPFFGNETTVGEIDFDALEDFFMHLKIERGLSGATVNKAINSGSVAFKYAASHKWLDENAMSGIMRFSTQSEKRGILEDDEVVKLFDMEWNKTKNNNLPKHPPSFATRNSLRSP